MGIILKYWQIIVGVIGALLAVLGFNKLRPRKSAGPPPSKEILDAHDKATRAADDRMADRLSMPGADRYRATAEWLRRRLRQNGGGPEG